VLAHAGKPLASAIVKFCAVPTYSKCPVFVEALYCNA